MTHSPTPTSDETTRLNLGKKLRNLFLAAIVVVLAIAIALGARLQSDRPSVTSLAEKAMPLEVALANGNPTFIEFYADWCVSCQTMAPGLSQVKDTYSDRLNFVMLNVDNDKWLPELLKYRVDAIPHFVYLAGDGTEVAQAIGEIPMDIIRDNLDALIAQQPLPYAETLPGTQSTLDPEFSLQGSNADPRSHGGI